MPGKLWIADHNFSTRAILGEWDRRGCGFIVREHSRTANSCVLEELCCQGRVADAMGPWQLTHVLLEIAAYAKPKTLRKHPRGQAAEEERLRL